MSRPSPPRCLPAPPESRRSARPSTSTGHLSSMPSIEPLRTSPWQTETVAGSPSSVGRPPQPPPSMLCTTKRRLVFGCTPKNTTEPPRRPWWPAGTRSGIAGASALTMVSTTVGTMMLQLDLEHAVVIHGGGGFVDAVRKRCDHVAALALGLLEDAVDCCQDGVAAVFVEQLIHAPCRQPTGGHLRFHVAERGFRKSDVVL